MRRAGAWDRHICGVATTAITPGRFKSARPVATPLAGETHRSEGLEDTRQWLAKAARVSVVHTRRVCLLAFDRPGNRRIVKSLAGCGPSAATGSLPRIDAAETLSADHIRASGRNGRIQRPDARLHPNDSRKRQILLLHRGRRPSMALLPHHAVAPAMVAHGGQSGHASEVIGGPVLTDSGSRAIQFAVTHNNFLRCGRVPVLRLGEGS